MPLTLIHCGDKFIDARNLRRTCKDRVKAESVKLNQAQDETAQKLGFESWSSMMSKSWTLSDEGILDGEAEGRHVSADLSEMFACSPLPKKVAELFDLRCSFVQIIEPGKEPHARVMFWDMTQHDDLKFLGWPDSREDMQEALTQESDRMLAISHAGLKICIEEISTHDPGSWASMPYHSAMEDFRRKTEGEDPLDHIVLEDPDDFGFPQMDDFFVYGLTFKQGELNGETGAWVAAISSYGYQNVAWLPDEQYSDIIFQVSVGSKSPSENTGATTTHKVKTGAAVEIHDEISSLADIHGAVFDC